MSRPSLIVAICGLIALLVTGLPVLAEPAAWISMVMRGIAI